MLYLNRLQGFNASARGAFCSEAKALIARMSMAPTLPRQYNINRLVVDLLNAGIWTTLDTLYVFAAHTSQAALLNWVAANTAAVAGAPSPTFTTDVGYASNTTGNIVGASNSRLSQTNHALGTYTAAISTQVDNNDAVIQAGSEYRIINRFNSAQTRCFSGNSTQQDVSGFTQTGHVAISRPDNFGYVIYSQGVQIAAPVQGIAGGGPGAVNFLNGCDAGITLNAGHTGSYLTSTQMAALKAALANYMAGL